MSTKVRYFDCVKEQSVGFVNGANKGNGNELHAPIGKQGNFDPVRELLKFEWNMDAIGGQKAVYQILKLEIIETRTSEVHMTFGSAPAVYARRLTVAFTEGGGAEGAWDSGAATHWGNKPANAGVDYSSGTMGTSHDATSKWDITGIGDAWAPTSVMRSDGTFNTSVTTNYGIEIRSLNESSTTVPPIEFYTRRATQSSGKRPQLKLTYDDNRPPNAPIINSPLSSGGGGDAVTVGTKSGTEVTIDFLFSDADAGDTLAAQALEFYGDGATDAAPGTAIATYSGTTTTTGASLGATDTLAAPSQLPATPVGPLNEYTVKATGLPARTTMRFRLKTKDSQGAWGAWSPLDTGRVKTAYKVGAPLNPLMTSVSDASHIYGTLNSPDAADTLSGWEGEFFRVNADATKTSLWAPNTLPGGTGRIDVGGGTRSDITYSGTALQVGDNVYWRQRHYNRDGVVGDWGAFITSVMVAQTGPTTMTPLDTSTKVLTRTPTFTIGNASNFDGYQYRVYRSGATIYDSGFLTVVSTASVTPSIPAGYLNWGDGVRGELSWDAAIRLTGGSALDPYSPQRQFRIDSLPSTVLSASA